MKKTLLFLLLFCGLAKAQTNNFPVLSSYYPPIIFVDSNRVYIPATGDTISLGGSGGSGVTSVGLSLPAIFSISGSPVTGSGTLTGTLASQSANLIFASPNGSSGTPTFRSLVSGDIPSLSYSHILTPQTSVNTKDTISNTSVTDTCFYTTVTLPANALSVGNNLHVRIAGFYSTALVAPTLRGKLKIGSVTIFNTGSLSTVAGVTNAGWFAEGDLTVVVGGATGKFMAEGKAFLATAATTTLSVILTNTAPSSAIDLTSNQTISVCITWGGTVGAGDSITLTQFIVTIE